MLVTCQAHARTPMTTIMRARDTMPHMPRASARIDPKTRARIAGWLRYKKEALGLTQRELARLIGWDEGAVSRVMNDVGPIGLDFVIAIHRKLHIDANQLLDLDPPDKHLRRG